MRITLGKFAIEEVLPYADHKQKSRREYTVDGVTYRVNMDSMRYATFKKSLACWCCNLTGEFFLLQIDDKYLAQKSAHFNLFAGNILMTKDHIVPKSKGGGDKLHNLRTMCTPCNEARGNDTKMKIEEIQKRRGIFIKRHV
jgi:5-methylcytosine-specific restriction endonuclease McrA